MRYHINISWSEEDGEYVADVPDLKYCSASGATPEEALREVLIAAKNWIEGSREAGMDVPEPRYRPGTVAG